jgi:CSLREA domain-containing protein
VRRLPLALTLVLGALAAGPSTAGAFTYAVTSTDDESDQVLNTVCDTAGAGIECTLRAAVQEANGTPIADVIVLPDLGGDYDLTQAGAGEDAAATGDLDLTRPVTIQGSGQPAIDGVAADRVLHVGPSNSPAVVLTGVEVRGGGGVENGAGILVDAGTLALLDTTVAGNEAESLAGTAEGGGVRIDPPGPHAFTTSTISGNTATGPTGALGGGVMLDTGASASFTNSTVSENTAASALGGDGGGIVSRGSASLTQTTMHLNSATGPGASGGSLQALGGTFSLTATIVASGSAATGSENCAGGGFTSIGNNLEAPAAPGFSQCGLFSGAPLNDRLATDGRLATLADRGGPTQTHALLNDSAALDAIPACPYPTDQRGEPRPSGAACEIGSFERQIQPPVGEGCFGQPPTIFGTPEKDTLLGGPGPDVILGQAGNDLIKGRGGKDLICAGKGSDRAFGGPSGDKIAGEDGKDRLFGQGGKDQLLGNAGRDVLDGGAGRDLANGGGKRDNCRGSRDKRVNC